jgi:hypothetical protein
VDFTARGARRDQDSGTGREGQSEWSAALTSRPLPSLQQALSYTGTYSETTDILTNSLSALARADVYEGVSAQATGSANLSTIGQERATFGAQASAQLSLVPNRFVTTSAGWLYSESTTYSNGVASPTSRFQRVDAGLTLTPGPALFASGSISRILQGPRPTTLATVQIIYTPLQGDLQVGVAMARTLDTAAEATSTLVTPSLRWNVRRNLYVNANYTLLDVEAPVQTTRSRVLSTSLVLYL